jgi:predicted ATPase
LEAVLAQATDDPAEAAPLLAELLSIPVGKRYSPLDLTPQKRKEKTLLALRAQVEGLATQQPALLLFEDAHWSDPTRGKQRHCWENSERPHDIGWPGWKRRKHWTK